MSVMFVKPAPGRRVLDPARRPPEPLPASGALVEESHYWRRRLSDGDVIAANPPPGGPAKPEAPPSQPAAPAKPARPAKQSAKTGPEASAAAPAKPQGE
jgi:hypothetical protein